MEILKTLWEKLISGDWAKLWQWLTEIRDWNTFDGWLARIVVFAASIFLLLQLVKKALEAYINISETWKKAGLPIQLSPEQRNTLHRRQQFCRVLRSDLDALNKAESWNDQAFTDLEVEVELDGGFYLSRIDRYLGRKSRGLRRAPSLIRAIESSAEQWLLLVGEPGSGKSIALRHLAYQLAENGVRSSDPQAKIPLYVNLKDLPPLPPGGPGADWVRAFIVDNIRRNDADTAAYVKEHWEEYFRKGIWFFLFDSFDEIPAVMHAPTGGSAIQEHAEALRRFLASMNDCRAIVASREFKSPDSLPWPRLRILPLGSERQEQLVANAFLSAQQRKTAHDYLALNDSLPRTPLFLTLLCRHIKDENRPPPNDHDLILRRLKKLAEREPEYLHGKHGLTPARLLEGATQLAVLLARSPELSLAPTRDQLAAALPQDSPIGGERLNPLLDALVDVKIGRNDVRTETTGDRRFSFAHRRYQETLFVRHLASHMGEIPLRSLLLDTRWREYTVALLQTEPPEVTTPVLLEAARWLASTSGSTPVSTLQGFGENLGYYDWGAEVHLIELLQEGLARNLKDIPAALTAAMEKMLLPRWKEGDFNDRLMVVRLCGLLPQGRLVEILEFAWDKGTDEMQELAFRQMGFLLEFPPAWEQKLRTRLNIRVLLARSRAELLRLEALSANLPGAVTASTGLRKATFLRRALRPLLFLARHLIRSLPANELLFPKAETREQDHAFAIITVLYLPIMIGFYLSASAFIQDGTPVLIKLGLMAAEAVFVILSFMTLTSILLLKNPGASTELKWVIAFIYTTFLLFTMATAALPAVGSVIGFLIDNPLPFRLVMSMPTVIVLILVTSALKKLRARREHRYRLNSLQAAAAQASVPLPLQARSLFELDTWLRAQREKLIPSMEHRRSLSRVILHGLETPAGTPVQGPPLVEYCTGHWPRLDARDVFDQLHGKT